MNPQRPNATAANPPATCPMINSITAHQKAAARISTMIAKLVKTSTKPAAPRAVQRATRASNRFGLSKSNQQKWDPDTAAMDRMAAAFQNTSESGVAHIPTNKRRNATQGANVPPAATLRYSPRRASTEGGRANKQNPLRDKAVNSKRPLVLVYSPRMAMASTINTAAASEASITARNNLGFMWKLGVTSDAYFVWYGTS